MQLTTKDWFVSEFFYHKDLVAEKAIEAFFWASTGHFAKEGDLLLCLKEELYDDFLASDRKNPEDYSSCYLFNDGKFQEVFPK